MIKNILWDVDGTLFDTYPGITYAISKSLNEMGLSIALNVIDGLARQSIDLCMHTLAQRFTLDLDLLRGKFAESYRTVDPANQLLFPGATEVCAYIHAHCGGNVVVTHRGVASTQRLLEVHGLAPYFNDIFSVEQGYPRKPDPMMALAALEKHGMYPAETLFIGDRDLDIQAGRGAGTRTCLFGQAKLTVPADVQISSYSQLWAYLDKEAGKHVRQS